MSDETKTLNNIIPNERKEMVAKKQMIMKADNLEDIDISKVFPKKVTQEDVNGKYLSHAFDCVDKAIEETKQESYALIKKNAEEEAAEAKKKEIFGDTVDDFEDDEDDSFIPKEVEDLKDPEDEILEDAKYAPVEEKKTIKILQDDYDDSKESNNINNENQEEDKMDPKIIKESVKTIVDSKENTVDEPKKIITVKEEEQESDSKRPELDLKDFEEPDETEESTTIKIPTKDAEVEKDFDKDVSDVPVEKPVSKDTIVIDKDTIEKEIKDGIDDLTDDDDNSEESDKAFKKFQNEIKHAVPVIKNKLDLSKVIGNIGKPIICSNTMPLQTNVKTADWVYYQTGQILTMRQFLGNDLNIIFDVRRKTGNALYTALSKAYKTIYNHITSPKPASFDKWIKTTKANELEDIYITILKVSFMDNLYMPYECDHCHKAFVEKGLTFDDIIKYKSPEIKTKVENMIKAASTELPKNEVEACQVSDRYLFTFKEPSIYDVVFEPSTLEDDFRDKYSDYIDELYFIDTMYYIDYENTDKDGNPSLRPIDVKEKEYANNPRRRLKEKLKTYIYVVNTLTSDQYGTIKGMISKKDKVNVDYHVIKPAVKCPNPECGKQIDEEDYKAQDLLFMRHQLTLIANM